MSVVRALVCPITKSTAGGAKPPHKPLRPSTPPKRTKGHSSGDA